MIVFAFEENTATDEHPGQTGRLKLISPSAPYMRHWTGTALVRVKVCRLVDAKPLPEPMLTYGQLGP